MKKRYPYAPYFHSQDWQRFFKRKQEERPLWLLDVPLLVPAVHQYWVVPRYVTCLSSFILWSSDGAPKRSCYFMKDSYVLASGVLMPAIPPQIRQHWQYPVRSSSCLQFLMSLSHSSCSVMSGLVTSWIVAHRSSSVHGNSPERIRNGVAASLVQIFLT